jgi:DNA-binding LacI/PurR family transcriptional regulator
MKKVSRKVRKLVKQQVKEITYQEAWNKVAEFMNKSGQVGFVVRPWTTDSILSKDCKDVFCLATIVDGEYVNYFVADKEWKNK